MQNGFLHLMHRDASSIANSSEYPLGTSSKLVRLRLGSCSGMGWRGTFGFLGLG